MRHIKRYARLAGSSVHKEQLTLYLINRNLEGAAVIVTIQGNQNGMITDFRSDLFRSRAF